MANQQKSAQKSKTSEGSARGSKPITLTPLQKILMVNGGVGHKILRSNAKQSGFKMTSNNRRKQEEA